MNPRELAAVAAQFGVVRAQVERDHLISHLLGYLSAHFADRIVFIGGTALARTHLVDGRLSEDIDLIAVGPRSNVARDLDRALPRTPAHSRALPRTPARSHAQPRAAGVGSGDWRGA